MAGDRTSQLAAEFEELGVSRVRAGLISGGWDAEKRQAARMWLERKDTAAWQASRPQQGQNSVPLKIRLQQSRWWPYVIGGLFVLLGAGRLLRRW